ncbi:hypothetical protein Bca4012_030178 [Brassica carinata]
MSSSNYFRSWIDRPHLDPNTRLLTEEYQRCITEFMGLVHDNRKQKQIWYHHGETDYEHGSTSEPQLAVRLEEPIRTDVDYGVGTEEMESNHCTKVAEMVIQLYHLLQD